MINGNCKIKHLKAISDLIDYNKTFNDENVEKIE